MTGQNVVAVLSLIVAAVVLLYLIIYVKATETIAKQSLEQTEAVFRPAVVVKPGMTAAAGPVLLNIGNGPAMELKWSVARGLKTGVFPYLEQRQAHNLEQSVMNGLRGMAVEARLPGRQSAEDELHPRLECEYRSLSGKRYTSSSRYDFNLGQFITAFGPTEG